MISRKPLHGCQGINSTMSLEPEGHTSPNNHHLHDCPPVPSTTINHWHMTIQLWGNATIIYWNHTIIIHRITLQMWWQPQRNTRYKQKDHCQERERSSKWNCHHLESRSQWHTWERYQEHAQQKPQATDPREKNSSQHHNQYFPEVIKSCIRRNKLVVTKSGITSPMDNIES